MMQIPKYTISNKYPFEDRSRIQYIPSTIIDYSPVLSKVGIVNFLFYFILTSFTINPEVLMNLLYAWSCTEYHSNAVETICENLD